MQIFLAYETWILRPELSEFGFFAALSAHFEFNPSAVHKFCLQCNGCTSQLSHQTRPDNVNFKSQQNPV